MVCRGINEHQMLKQELKMVLMPLITQHGLSKKIVQIHPGSLFHKKLQLFQKCFRQQT